MDKKKEFRKKNWQRFNIVQKIIVIISFFAFSACQNHENTQGEATNIKINEKPITAVEAGEYITDLKAIPLETNEHSLIGQIWKLRFYKERFYVLDTDNNSLLIFSSKGKFINKINSVGKGPEEYLFIDDFTIDQQNDIIIIKGGHFKIMKYNLNGEFIDEKRIEFAPISIDVLNDGTFYCWIGNNHDERSNETLYYVDEEFKIKETYFPNNNRCITSPNMFSKYNGELYFKPRKYTDVRSIYALTSKGIYKKYNIDFGKYNWPDSAKYDQRLGLKARGLFYCIGNFFETDRYISFEFVQKGLIHGAFYNKQSKESFWWQWNKGKSIFGTAIGDIKYMQGEDYYSCVEPYLLINNKANYEKNLRNKESKIDSLGKKIVENISNLNEVDNPVIFQFKLK